MHLQFNKFDDVGAILDGTVKPWILVDSGEIVDKVSFDEGLERLKTERCWEYAVLLGAYVQPAVDTLQFDGSVMASKGAPWGLFSVDTGPSVEAMKHALKMGFEVEPEFVTVQTLDEGPAAGTNDWFWLQDALAEGMSFIAIPDDVGSPYYRWYLLTERPSHLEVFP